MKHLALAAALAVLPALAWGQTYPFPNAPYAGEKGTGAPSISDQILVQQGVTSHDPVGSPARMTLGTLQSLIGTAFTGGNIANPITVPGVTNSGSETVAGTLLSSGSLTIGSGTFSAVPMTINGAASTAKQLRWDTTGILAWAWGLDGTARSGGNAGDNWAVNRYDDSGTLLDRVFSINRASGLAQFLDGLTVAGSSGATVSGGALQLSHNVTYSGTNGASNAQWWSNINYSGTASDTGNFAFNLDQINDTTVLSTDTTANVFDWTVRTGAGLTGQRNAGVFDLIQTAQSGNSALGWQYAATTLSSFFFAGASEGGTGLSNTTSLGAGWAFGTVAQLNSGATNWRALTGYEDDISVSSGASVAKKVGMQIVKTSNDAVQGAVQDVALSVSDQVGAAVGWNNGLWFGSSLYQWPMASGSTLIGASAGVNSGTVPTLAAWGIDLSPVTFSGGFLKSTGFTVDGSGNTTVASLKVGATAGVTCTGTPTASFASIGGVVTHC